MTLINYPDIKKWTNDQLLTETSIMMIAIEGEEYLTELIEELKVRGLVDQKGMWTWKGLAQLNKLKPRGET